MTMSKRHLLLFDVDGTLAESSQSIDEEVRSELIKKQNMGYVLGIVGGGKLEKILEQLKGLYITHYFTECGCVYNKNVHPTPTGDLLLEHVYTKNVRAHRLYSKINILIKCTLQFLSTVDYEITGHFVDLRSGLVYLSLIGMAATLDERAVYKRLDREHAYRKSLLKILYEKAKEMGVHEEVCICEGGEVGIAIYPVEFDKCQVIDHVSDEYDEIHYFGDKYQENGNDKTLIECPRVIGHRVDSPAQTREELLNIY